MKTIAIKIKASLNTLPFRLLQREVFSGLTDSELNNMAQTCKSLLQTVVNDEASLRRRAISRGIQLLPNTPALKQLQDSAFQIELDKRLKEVPRRVFNRADRVETLQIRIFSGLMMAATATSSAPLSIRAFALIGNIPLLVSKPEPYFVYFSRHREFRNIGMITLGALQMGAGYGFLACSVVGENPYGYRFSIALIETGVTTMLRADNFNVIISNSSLKIDEKVTRTYIKCSAYAERAMRRSCCVKVSSAIGAVKRYTAEALVALVKPIVRLAGLPTF